MLFATTGIHTHKHTHTPTHTPAHTDTHTLTKLKDHAKPNVDHVFINQIAAIMCTCKTMTSVMSLSGLKHHFDIQGTAVPKGPPGSLDVSYVRFRI